MKFKPIFILFVGTEALMAVVKNSSIFWAAMSYSA
jgi:hypothetical protein